MSDHHSFSHLHMGLVATNPVFGVSNKARIKPVSSATETTVNVLKFRTLKNNYFSAVRNFGNYVSEKVLVFVILECGL